MSKYNIGDSFLITITEVDEGGMGTGYIFNHAAFINEKDVDNFDLCPLSTDEGVIKTNEKAHTPEDLLERITKICKLLNETIEKYCEIRGILDVGIPNIDKDIEGFET